MAFARVRGATANGNGVASVAVTLASPVTSGNLVTVFVGQAARTGLTPQITDNQSNTWPTATLRTDTAFGVRAFSLANVTNGPQTFTYWVDVAHAATDAFISVFVDEWSGVLTTSPLDGSSSGDQSTTLPTTAANAVTSGSFATTSGNLILGFTVDINGVGAMSAGSGFTVAQTVAAAYMVEYKTGSASTDAATFTASVNGPYMTLGEGFKPSSGAPTAGRGSSKMMMGVGGITGVPPMWPLLGGAALRAAAAVKRNRVMSRRRLLIP